MVILKESQQILQTGNSKLCWLNVRCLDFMMDEANVYSVNHIENLKFESVLSNCTQISCILEMGYSREVIFS